jgi:hypothetical protein
MDNPRDTVDLAERFIRIIAARWRRDIEPHRMSNGRCRREPTASEDGAALGDWHRIPRHVASLYAASKMPGRLRCWLYAQAFASS